MPAFDREKWNAKYSDPEAWPRNPSAVLMALDAYLPRQGKALDVAGGPGRNALWLAARGLDVTIADISPVGLALAQQRAAEAGLSIQTLEVDLQEEPLPAGPWDLIVSVCHLWRPLFSAYPAALAAGGVLAIVQPTRRNLERHEKPPFDFLLADGELPQLIAGLEVVHYVEGWQADDRHDSVLVARKPGR